MNDEINQYLLEMVPEQTGLLLAMEQYAETHHVPIMEPNGIATMLQIMKIQQATRILEIGTAIGYSALRILHALPNSKVVTIELDEERAGQAKSNFNKANVDSRVTLIQGNALECFNEVESHGPFDAIFIDAARGQYQKFFDMYSELLTDDGVIYSDNVLFKGMVAQKEDIESKRLKNLVKKIKNFNEWLKNHPKYETVIIPVGDGIAISRKK